MKTLAAIDYMVTDIKDWKGGRVESLTDELRRSWNEDMLWWGPAGIGATYTIERYAEQHSGPFRAGFKDRIFNGHICRMAEGSYGGFFGWPNLTLTPTGGFMGMPASEVPGDMRVIDMYRRDGDKLTEKLDFHRPAAFLENAGCGYSGADDPRAAHLIRRQRLTQPHRITIGEGRITGIMADQQCRDATVTDLVTHKAAELTAAVRVQRGKGLVHQQRLRLRQHGAHQGDPRGLTA